MARRPYTRSTELTSIRQQVVWRKIAKLRQTTIDNRSKTSAGWLVGLLLFFSFPAQAEQSSIENSNEKSNPRHRIDLTGVFLDAQVNNSVNGLLGYTFSLNERSNLSVTLPYVDPALNTGGDSGFGDLVTSFSFVPSANISANPWVPRTVGSGIAVSAPTGNADEGRGLDTWVVFPFLGVVLPLSERFFFAPQIGYLHSIDTTVSGGKLRMMTIDTGLSFVTLTGFWVSYFPKFARDLETDDWSINHRLGIGKMFTRNFGLSFDYTFVDRFNFGTDIPAESGFDQLLELNLHFTF